MDRAKAFLTIYAAVVVSYLGVGLVAPLIAIVLEKHGESPFLIGLIGTTMFAAFTFASFPIGAMTDRVGPKPILIGGLIVYGASIALFAMIQETWLFFLARAIEGVGAAAVSVAVETMISRMSEPHERARRMSYYALSVGLGWAAGPLTGTVLFDVRPWLPFIACFVFSMVSAILVAGFVPKTDSEIHHHESLASGISLQMAVPMSAGALYGYLMSSLVTLIPIYMGNRGIEKTRMGVIITAVIMGVLISQVPLGKAADHFGKRKTLLFCTSILAVVFYVMAIYDDWRIFIVTGALAGALAGSLYPIGLAIIGGIVRKEKLGAANSLFSLCFGLGSLTGPALSGYAMENFSDRWLFYLPAALTAAFVTGFVAFYGKVAPRRRAAAQDT
ncbi:MAG TPA: MFS transporter [Blastocatellia bacterium]